uniref:Resolvase/invertase-type recombinase catalytic domain-containing protein n=1 Tax=viral metagenome TaxID=1070528 RepID=A0A6C0C9W2_9ZZZZ
MTDYVKRKEVLKVLKVHYQTLYRMEDRGEIDVIRSEGGHRLYNLNKYLKEKQITNVIREKICYCRVSSRKQQPDLKRQIEVMKKKYPDHRIIKDVGSGLNMKRKGLQEIIDMSINGKLEELVIAYKDRLARFGYEMIEWIIEKYSSGKIKIINKEEEETPEEEITKDVMQIMNVYVVKMNGRRKYSLKDK